MVHWKRRNTILLREHFDYSKLLIFTCLGSFYLFLRHNNIVKQDFGAQEIVM